MAFFSRLPVAVPRFSRDFSCFQFRIQMIRPPSSITHSQIHQLSRPTCAAQKLSCRSFASKAAKKAKSRKKSPNDSTPSPPPPRPEVSLKSAPQTYATPKDAYAQLLASKNSSTLLYSNVGNPEVLSLLSALVGGYCIVYGGFWLYEATLVHHPGLWKPINYMNGAVGIFMAGVGISVLRRTRGQIGSITAIPARQTTGGSGLLLQVEGRNSFSLPLFWKRPVQWKSIMPQKVVNCNPPEIRLIDRIADVRSARSSAADADAQKSKDELLAKDPSGLRFGLDPIRRLFRTFKMWMLKILVGEGFVNVQVQGKKFRMDVNSGWLLEGGQPLERLLNAK